MKKPLFSKIKKLLGFYKSDCAVSPFLFDNQKNLIVKMEKVLRAGSKLAAIYFDIAKFRQIETIYGPNVCKLVLRAFQESVDKLKIEDSGVNLIGWHSLGGDDIALYLETESNYTYNELSILATQLHKQAEGMLNQRVNLPKLQLHLGYAFMDTSTTRSLESMLYDVLKETLQIAKTPLNNEYWQQVEELKNIIGTQNIATLYQPIISLQTGEIFGYEALSRGPCNSSLHSPEVLFSLAEKAGYLYPLEKICRKLAIERFQGYLPEQKLFLNFNPEIINDPNFAGGITKQILEKKGLKQQNIVWEITERTSIKDFSTFKQALKHYRSQGYLIALDDAGAGYSSLQSIAELHPDFIKIDMSLVSGISRNPVKKALIETFVTFASKINAALIAEGIEEEEDLKTLKELGVTFGQGYLIARPAFPLPQAKKEIIAFLGNISLEKNIYNPEDIKAADLMVNALTCQPEIMTKSVLNYFKNNPDLNSIVIVSNDQPQGLVMRDKLYSRLASQYGVSLYWEKPISMLMDANPFKVEADISLSALAQSFRNRPHNKLYDDIIVMKGSRYLGTIPAQKLLDTLTEIKVELARITIPLTNLPGGPIIQEKLKQIVQAKKPFAVVYADLDNFKAYNDKYGFERGDEVIKLAALAIKHAVSEHGTPEDFIGHVGGDDFVIITHPNVVDQLCQEIISYFDHKIKDLYDLPDRERGGILTLNRTGKLRLFPFTSISLVAVDNLNKNFSNHLEIGGILADLKKYAKSIEGSTYIRDRRK